MIQDTAKSPILSGHTTRTSVNVRLTLNRQVNSTGRKWFIDFIECFSSGIINCTFWFSSLLHMRQLPQAPIFNICNMYCFEAFLYRVAAIIAILSFNIHVIINPEVCTRVLIPPSLNYCVLFRIKHAMHNSAIFQHPPFSVVSHCLCDQVYYFQVCFTRSFNGLTVTMYYYK